MSESFFHRRLAGAFTDLISLTVKPRDWSKWAPVLSHIDASHTWTLNNIIKLHEAAISKGMAVGCLVRAALQDSRSVPVDTPSFPSPVDWDAPPASSDVFVVKTAFDPIQNTKIDFNPRDREDRKKFTKKHRAYAMGPQSKECPDLKTFQKKVSTRLGYGICLFAF